MNRDYAIQYRHLYLNHWWWRARERFILRRLRHALADRPASRLLDVGCGDGLLLDKLEQFGSPEGLETDPDIVTAEGRRKGRIHLGSLHDFSPGYGFHVIIMADVLEHVADQRGFLARAAQLLEPRGRILVTLPALAALWTRHDELNHHYRRYDRAALRTVAREAGLIAESMEYFFMWMVLPKLTVRLAQKVLPPRPASVTVPPFPVNRAATCLSLVEQQVARLVPLPVGSSLCAWLRPA